MEVCKTLFDIHIVVGFGAVRFDSDDKTVRENLDAHDVVSWKIHIDIDNFKVADIEDHVRFAMDGIRGNAAAKECLDLAESFCRHMMTVLSSDFVVTSMRLRLGIDPKAFLQYSHLVLMEDGKCPTLIRATPIQVYSMQQAMPDTVLDFDKTCTTSVLQHILSSRPDQGRIK
jgi:hypothetical protein